MKRLLIPFSFVVICMNAYSQDYASVSNEKEYQLERIDEIQKEVKKLEKNIKHSKKSLQKGDSEKRVAERQLQLLRERQDNNREMHADVLASMRGYNLEALEDKIDLLEKDHNKLGRDNARKSKSIARKRAQIEKLEQEILVLEGGIENNEDRMDIKMNEIQDTREIIVGNALESKTERLALLSKDYDKLMDEEEKMRMKIGKIDDSMIRSESELRMSESQKSYLQKEEKEVRKSIKQVNNESRSY